MRDTFKTHPLKVDSEFSKLLRPQTTTEREELRKSIINDGRIREPIYYWLEEDCIVDGHNRIEIWLELEGIEAPFIEGISFPDRRSVRKWIYRNQVGRRNCNKDDFDIYSGELYEDEKLDIGRPVFDESKNGENGENVPYSPENTNNVVNFTTLSDGPKKPPKKQPKKKDRTAERIAKELGVSEKTVRTNGEYVRALKTLGELNPRFEQDIRSGDLKVKKPDVIKAAKLPKEYQGKSISNLKLGKPWNQGIDTSYDTPNSNGKAPTPSDMLIQANKLFGKVGSLVLDACNEDSSINRSGWDKLAKDVVFFLLGEAKKAKSCK